MCACEFCFGYCQDVYGLILILCIHVLHYFPDCSQFDTGRWPSSVNHSFVRSFVMSVCQSLSLFASFLRWPFLLARFISIFFFNLSVLLTTRDTAAKGTDCPMFDL